MDSVTPQMVEQAPPQPSSESQSSSQSKSVPTPLAIGIILVLVAILLATSVFLYGKSREYKDRISKQKGLVAQTKSLNEKSDKMTNSTTAKVASNIYSNGWFEYSFHYPTTGYIYDINDFRGDAKLGPFSWDIKYIAPSGSCDFRAYVINNETTNTQPTSVETFNNIPWKKRKSKESISYLSASNIMWQTDHAPFRYDILTGNRYDPKAEKDDAKTEIESTCEQLLPTFSFAIDPSQVDAVEAQRAKKAAVAYGEKTYPGKQFLTGTFLALDSTSSKLIKSSKATDIALVVLGTTSSYTSESEKARVDLKLVKKNSDWSVEGLIERTDVDSHQDKIIR